MLRSPADSAAEDIGLALRRYRIAARLNQAEIARCLGVSQSRVSRWESGRETPRAATLNALAALIWGRDDPVLNALIHQVREAMSPQVLCDARLTLVAASRFLRLSGGPLGLFGPLFEKGSNDALAGLARRFRDLAEDGHVAARMSLPFVHDGMGWVCTMRLTYCPIGPRLYGLGEMSFLRARDGAETEPRIVGIARHAQ